MNKAGKKREFPCCYCDTILCSNFSLKRHTKRVHHGVSLDSKTGNCVCLHCKETFVRIADLRNHLATEHGLKFSIETKYFQNESEFERWKTNLERREVCRFSKKQGTKSLSTGEKVAYHQCNRSGTYRSSCKGETRARQMKRQGSCKIGWNCTATMKVKHNMDRTLEVEVCYTHYGHSKDVKHIPANKTYETDLKNLKEKLQENIQQLLVKIGECEDLEVLQEIDKRLSFAENNVVRDHDYHKTFQGQNIRYVKSSEGSRVDKDWTCYKCLLSHRTNMIQCEGCHHWFDWTCAGITAARDEWCCENCQDIRINE